MGSNEGLTLSRAVLLVLNHQKKKNQNNKIIPIKRLRIPKKIKIIKLFQSKG
jgi:hypothetical protein